MNKPNPIEIKRTSAWHMYGAIVGIGTFCALLIVTVFVVTAERIAANQAEFLAGAVAEVLPAASTTVAVTTNEAGQLIQAPESASMPVFLGYDEYGELVGAVLTAQRMGYADIVRVLYAYSFEQQAITGFKVLDSKETPGLGDKVETEPHFVANFEALDARLNTDGTGLNNSIVTVSQGQKTEPWQVDGITGATITSVAIGAMLNESAEVWVPILERDARDFVPTETTEGDQ